MPSLTRLAFPRSRWVRALCALAGGLFLWVMLARPLTIPPELVTKPAQQLYVAKQYLYRPIFMLHRWRGIRLLNQVAHDVALPAAMRLAALDTLYTYYRYDGLNAEGWVDRGWHQPLTRYQTEHALKAAREAYALDEQNGLAKLIDMITHRSVVPLFSTADIEKVRQHANAGNTPAVETMAIYCLSLRFSNPCGEEEARHWAPYAPRNLVMPPQPQGAAAKP